jgi:monothiol bacilliredoxin
VAAVLVRLDDVEGWEAVKARARAVVYKHSTRCWGCRSALRAVTTYAERHADVPVYIVDVLVSRDLAQTIASDSRVRHESPQVLVLRDGHVAWHASHSRVTLMALEEATRA